MKTLLVMLLLLIPVDPIERTNDVCPEEMLTLRVVSFNRFSLTATGMADGCGVEWMFWCTWRSSSLECSWIETLRAANEDDEDSEKVCVLLQDP